MDKRQKFFKCAICGNIIGMVENKGGPLKCCNQSMTELIPNTVEASQEKHLPLVKVDGNHIAVNVGSVMHPMTAEHKIDFVYVETEKGGMRKSLNGEPKAEFVIIDDKAIAAYAYCNLHGLWKTEI